MIDGINATFGTHFSIEIASEAETASEALHNIFGRPPTRTPGIPSSTH
jgi:hypothetical protein